MKKSINLLIRKKSYEYKEKIFTRIRIAIVIIGVLCLSSLVIVYSLKMTVQTQKQRLLSKKEEYLSALLTKKDIEKKVVFFDKKSTELVNILKDDVRFLEYYQFLTSHLSIYTPSAEISQAQFDNKRKVSVTLNFLNYNDFYNLLESYESDQFLTIFDSLTLSSFDVSPGEANEAFKIVLSGSLKPIKK